MSEDKKETFTASVMTAIADALGDTDKGLTGTEIGHLLETCHIDDVSDDLTKRLRLYNAFANDQNTRGHRKHILAFIRHSMKPERYLRAQHRFEPMRSRLNQALSFAGIAVSDNGQRTKPLAR